MITHISSFETISGSGANIRDFFRNLFARLNFPFLFFPEDETLIDEHRAAEPGLRSYDQLNAVRFFAAPSFGFTHSGSRNYCFWYSSVWLRTFLDLLRIASYIYPGQRDFGRDVKMMGPNYPVFLGDHAGGVLKFDEDRKESWAKIPDGCLFLSFGYRGLAKMWLDRRTFPKIDKFMLEHRTIFDSLTNPWNSIVIRDIAPTLDILGSATQIPSLGAKILLIYTTLEHLFVPVEAKGENKKYIIGGLTALAPGLLEWFYELYNLRNSYAHRGFVYGDNETQALIARSMQNATEVLVRKLSVVH